MESTAGRGTRIQKVHKHTSACNSVATSQSLHIALSVEEVVDSDQCFETDDTVTLIEYAKTIEVVKEFKTDTYLLKYYFRKSCHSNLKRYYNKMSKSSMKMECPFTWEISEHLSKNFDEKEEPTIGADEEPLLAFINSMMITYFRAVQGDSQGALENLEATEAIWKIFNETLLNGFGISKRVLIHAKEATKYYFYKFTSCESEANEILKNIEDGGNFCSATELASISGCKSVVWSKFHEKAHRKATETARLAIAGSPDCPLWHYILAKALKHARREDYGINKPSAEEENAIIRSSQLSDTPFYKIHLAQMYREQKKLDEAKSMYLDIYKTNPQGQEILLRLARAFTSLRDFEKASLCFKKAEKYPKNTMYHHYKGIFFIKTKEFEKAALHLQEATEYENYRADLLYACTMQKINNNFDFIAHLKTMLGKYTKFPKHEQQTLLHIVMHYYKNNDMKNTLAYLLKAIEFDPQSKILESYMNTTINWEFLNIYDFAHEKLQEIINRKELIMEMKDTVKKLRDYCQEYRNRNLPIF